MKLRNNDVEARLITPLNKSIKGDNDTGIMNYGAENDYPQVIEKIILSSQTAKLCVNAYSKFIGGGGFVNPQIGSIVVGKDTKGKDITLDKIRRRVAKSIAMYNGAYIHCNINLAGIIGNVRIVPFKDGRLSKEDSNGNSAKIAVYRDWTSKIKKDSIAWYPNFNLRSNVIESQFEDAAKKGKEHTGQIYSFYLDEDYIYPLSPFDCAYLDADTEYQVQLFKNREIRNGMSDKVLITVDEDEDEQEAAKLDARFLSWMGSEGDKTLIVEAAFDPATGELAKGSAFKIDTIVSNVNDKLFDIWDKSLPNNIRKAVSIPSVLIDFEGGNYSNMSGEVIKQATEYYNAMTRDDREAMSEMLEEIFSNFDNEILRNNTNWELKPVELYGTTTDVQSTTSD